MNELKVEMNFYLPMNEGETKEEAIERFYEELKGKDIAVWDFEVREI